MNVNLLQSRGSFDAVAAPVALALGFFLVGLVLVVVFPLVSLTALSRRVTRSPALKREAEEDRAR